MSQWSLTVEAPQTSASEEKVAYRVGKVVNKIQAFLEQSGKDQLEFERTQLEMRL